MNLRLSEKHPLYGMAGLVYPPEQLGFVPFNDKDLFEKVENTEWYVKISVIVNNEEFEYLIMDHNELLVIVMKYTEPANLKFIKLLLVEIRPTSMNSMIIYQGMIALMDIYDFKLTMGKDFSTFSLKYKHEKD